MVRSRGSTLETFFQKYQSEETKKETATDKREIDADQESCGSSTNRHAVAGRADVGHFKVLAQKMNAQETVRSRQEEFTSGMRQLQCDSMVKLKKKIPAMRQELVDSYAFKAVYEYAFRFSKEENQKALNLDTACAMTGNFC